VFVQGLDDCEQTFIKEVFAGCVRYKSVLNVVLHGFYNRDGQTAPQADETLYRGQLLSTFSLMAPHGTL